MIDPASIIAETDQMIAVLGVGATLRGPGGDQAVRVYVQSAPSKPLTDGASDAVYACILSPTGLIADPAEGDMMIIGSGHYRLARPRPRAIGGVVVAWMLDLQGG